MNSLRPVPMTETGHTPATGEPLTRASRRGPGLEDTTEVNRMRSLPRSALLALFAVSLVGCGTTVESLGVHSSAPLSSSKTLVLVDLGTGGSSSLSCDAEVGLARQLTSLGATASCSLPFDSERTDVSALRESATAAGYESILSLKLLTASTDAIQDYALVGNQYYGLHTPSSTTALFGAAVVSLRDQRLLWAARVTRYNADLHQRDLRSVQQALLQQLRADGILQ